MDFVRRELMSAGLATSATWFLSGCVKPAPADPISVKDPQCSAPTPSASTPDGSSTVIDAHCHLFNVKDLPAAKFVRIVFVGAYDEQPDLRGKSVLNELRDPTFVDRFIAFCINVLAHGAPTAEAEIERLSGRAVNVNETTTSLEASEAFVSAALSAKLLEPLTGMGDEDRVLRAAILKAGEPTSTVGEMSLQSSVEVGTRAFQSDTDLGVFVRWVSALRMHRADLAKALAADEQASGRRPILLTPAMVDYSLWLGEALSPASSFQKQVEVMGLVSRQPNLPPVHGYVSFDPLRAVLRSRGIRPDPDDGSWDPLELVRTATEQHGFLGVKLYPPMGFRASGNDASVTPSKAVWKLVGDDPEHPNQQRFADDLNASLEALYVHCEAAGLPIMAHGGAGNSASKWSGLCADPTYWVPVFRTYPRLRVMLAHFGVFAFKSGQLTGYGDDKIPFDQTWEATFGRYVAANENCLAFADISYRSNIFNPDARTRCAAGIRDYVAKYDRDVRHLVFGSDWIMLGIEKNYPGYTRQVAEFLSQDCCLGPEALDRVMTGNAMRFLGLRSGEPSRLRLEAFWTEAGLPADRVPFDLTS